MLNLTEAQINAIRNGYPRIFLVEYILDTPMYLTDSMVPINWNGHTWQNGLITNISDTESTDEIKIAPIDVTLTAVPPEVVTAFKTNQYRNRRSNIYLAFVDLNHQLVGEPLAYHQGLIEKAPISDQQSESSIRVTSSSIWRDFEKTVGRRTNNNSNHRFYPDDDGFYAATLNLEKMPWGRKAQTNNPVYQPKPEE